MKCPRCGAEANGAFCSSCGSRLDAPRACSRCAAPLPDGARFCVQCGARAGAANGWLRFAVPAGIAALALIGGYWLGTRDDDPSAPVITGTPMTGNASPGSPPPLTGSLRDQADRLFERIMQARARGNTAEVRFFMPMALQAYEGAGELDADGLFHLGLLQLENGSAAEAAATAERIRNGDPSHLFGYALAGEAALATGDQGAARTAFAGFLEHYEREVARALPEYEMHGPALEEYATQARQVTSR